jgi:hypothetical protein
LRCLAACLSACLDRHLDLALEDLAIRALGQLVDEPDHAWVLVTRRLVVASASSR